MQWNNANVSVLITLVVTISNGVNWLINQNDKENQLLRAQLENQQAQELQSKEYQSRIDILINQHERELRNIYIKLEDIDLEIEKQNNEKTLNKHLNQVQ